MNNVQLILRCPFCIFEVAKIETDTSEHGIRYQIFCLGCGARSPICRSEREAKSRWTKVVNKVNPT